MKIQIKEERNTYFITSVDNALDISNLNSNIHYNQLPNHKNICLNFNSIEEVDASGLTWLLDLINKIVSKGLNVTSLILSNSIKRAIQFLEINHLVPDLTIKKSIAV